MNANVYGLHSNVYSKLMGTIEGALEGPLNGIHIRYDTLSRGGRIPCHRDRTRQSVLLPQYDWLGGVTPPLR